MGISAHASYSSEGVDDVPESGRKLCCSAIVFVEVNAERSYALVAILYKGHRRFTVGESKPNTRVRAERFMPPLLNQRAQLVLGYGELENCRKR